MRGSSVEKEEQGSTFSIALMIDPWGLSFCADVLNFSPETVLRVSNARVFDFDVAQCTKAALSANWALVGPCQPCACAVGIFVGFSGDTKIAIEPVALPCKIRRRVCQFVRRTCLDE